MADKICPLHFEADDLHSMRCMKESCAWYLADEGRCAVASLPTVLDWAVRIAATKPYEEEEDAK